MHEVASGVALIMVDSQGHNLIVTAPGSNRRLTVADIQGLEADAFVGGILLTQLETPLETVEYGLRRALEAGMTTILNPAPGRLLSPDFLALAAHHYSQRDRSLSPVRRAGHGSGHRQTSRGALAGLGMSHRDHHAWSPGVSAGAAGRGAAFRAISGDAGRYHRRRRCVQWCARDGAPRRTWHSMRRSCVLTPLGLYV